MHWLTFFIFFLRITTSLLQALNETDIPETPNATTTAPVIKGPKLATVLVPCVIGGVVTLGIVLFFLVLKIRETQHLERTLSTRHLDPTGVVLPNNSFKLPPVERLI